MAAKFPGDIFGECCVCERSIEYRAKAFSGCGHNICEHCWYKYKFPTHYSSILCPICADRRKRSESFVNSAQESNSDANHDEGCIADMLGPDVLLQFNVQQASDLFSVQEDPQELSQQQISSQHRHGLGIEMLLIPQNQEISGGVCMVCNSAANHVSEFSDKLLCKQCAQIYKKAVAEPQYTHPHVFYFEEHPVQQKSTSSPTPITFTFFKQEQPCSVPPFPAALPPDDSYNVKPASHVQQTMQQNFQQHQLPRQFQSSQVRQSQPQETQCYHLLSVQPPPVPRNHILHNHQSPFSSDPFQSHESSASKVRSHHSSAPVSTARAITNHPSDLMTNQIFSTSLRSCSTNSTLLSNQLLKPSSGPAVEKDSRALSQRNSPALDCTDLRNELPSQFTKQLFQENQFESQQSMWEQSGRSVLAPYGDSCNMERFSPFGFQNQPNHWPHPTSPISSLVEKASSLPVGSVHSQKSPILTSNDKLSFQVNGPNSHLRVCSCSEVSNKCTEESECRVGIQNSSSEDLTQWDQIAELWDKLHLIERDRESYKDYLFEQPILIDNREDTVCAEIKDHFRMIQEKLSETEQNKLVESHKIAEGKRATLKEYLLKTEADLAEIRRLMSSIRRTLELEQGIAACPQSADIVAFLQRLQEETLGPFNVMDYKFLPPDEKVLQYISAIGSVTSESEPKSCIVRSEDLHYTVCGGKGKFVVIPQNAANQSVCDQGFSAYITTPDKKEHALIVDKIDENYIFNFTFSDKGKHTLMIKVRGHRVAASPYTINCQEGYTYVSVSKGPDAVFLDRGELNRAWGMAVNRSSPRLYIADRGNHRIVACSIKEGHHVGPIEFTFGEEGEGPGQFKKPVSVAYSTFDGRVAVVDKDNHRIQVFTEKGRFLFEAGALTASHQVKKPPPLAFNFPWDIAYSPDGNMAVSDSKNNRIQLLDKDGNFLKTIGESFLLDSVRGITFDSQGNLYATDFNFHRLVVFAASTGFAAFAVYRVAKADGLTGLNRPQGICVDRLDNVLVADSKNMRILVFSKELFGSFLADPTSSNERHYVGMSREVLLHPTAIYTTPNREGNTQRLLSIASAPDGSLLCMYQSEERTSSLSNSDESLENGGTRRTVMGNCESRNHTLPFPLRRRAGSLMNNGKDSLKNDAGSSRAGSKTSNSIHGVKNAVWLFLQDTSCNPKHF